MDSNSNRPNLKQQTIKRKTLRKNATTAEAILWKALRNKQVEGLKFRRQYGFGAYILDFYCVELRLCIELDGNVHNTSYTAIYDEKRTRFLEENDITVIRYGNEVVFHNINSIIDDIKNIKNSRRK